ncbi:MAG: DUF5694 domain-containing protein [Bacteroidota bacterium]
MIRAIYLSLFVGVLFSLNLHATPPPDSETPGPIQVMVVGTHYLPVDIMRNARQKEVDQLVNNLGRFQPDQVVLHVPFASEGENNLNQDYQQFREGIASLNRSVEHQLGFRLANVSDVPALRGLDDEQPLNLASELQASNVSDDKAQINLLLRQGRGIESTKQWHSMQSSVQEYLLYLNQRENLQYEHSLLLKGLSQIRSQHQYAGADILADWYAYHLRMFSNLQAIVSQERSERVVILMPSSHVPILKELIDSDPQLEWVEPSAYLTVQ